MLLVAAAILFAGLGQGDIRIDGPIYAWAAKYMVISGDWLNLYYDHGQTPYFNKPPLQIWLMALVFKALGYSTFSAKLVSVLFGLGCVAMVYAIARLRFEPAVAATVGIVLATTYTFIRNTAAVRLDAGVTFFFLVALFAGARMLLSPEPRLRHWIVLGAACGLALMIKSGAALLCVPILVGAFAWNRRRDLLFNWRGVIAAAVCAAIVLPWYLHQYHTWGQAFIDQHFRQQLLGRFESTTFGSTVWYAYLRDLTIRYWPWLPFVIFGTYRLFRALVEPRTAEGKDLDRLLIVWALGSLVLLHLLPRKYDRYLLFVYPVLAMLGAYGLQRSALWPGWKTLILPNLGWASALVLVVLQLSHIQFHVTAYPELAQTIPMIKRSPVYALGRVPMGAQCNIRFFTNAKVKPIEESYISRLEPGDVLVFPRAQQSALAPGLSPHETLAQGKELIFIKID
jgi:4-amino-4-deoxy-L-arabinose transferase-like glycosyltransferase